MHEDKRPIQCPYLEYTCGEKRDLKNHILAVHERKKPLECSHCDYRAKQIVSHLKRHITAIHMDNKPSFKCDLCRKSVISKRSLELHIASFHKGWKPFLCSNCNLSFALKVNFKKHNESVHEKKKPFL